MRDARRRRRACPSAAELARPCACSSWRAPRRRAADRRSARVPARRARCATLRSTLWPRRTALRSPARSRARRGEPLRQLIARARRACGSSRDSSCRRVLDRIQALRVALRVGRSARRAAAAPLPRAARGRSSTSSAAAASAGAMRAELGELRRPDGRARRPVAPCPEYEHRSPSLGRPAQLRSAWRSSSRFAAQLGVFAVAARASAARRAETRAARAAPSALRGALSHSRGASRGGAVGGIGARHRRALRAEVGENGRAARDGLRGRSNSACSMLAA